mmetsp:Transcript_17844/g.37088  ORF Transcript_17844/g.37088 Transcript_17844/m.37088 type:complete len:1082 (+) Transcript_17844:13-3258(+)
MDKLSINDPPPPPGKKPSLRKDTLRGIELETQAKWEDAKVFEADANSSTSPPFMVTFPYPYMNGRLHLGHAFSLTKAIFRAQYERNKGKNVLFPFAFHCTGMPIQAAANKLKAEIEKFGCPPKFPEQDPEVLKKMMEEAEAEAAKKAAKKTEGGKKKGAKSKLVAKGYTGIVRQWNILTKMVPESEIPKFVDPEVWLQYFPPHGLSDLKRFGSGVDWRRSFITTATNQYYDSFIRWQFNVLKSKGKVLFGKRNNIWSVLDNQVCADHDRSEGEGVGPQEYTIIKLKVLEFPGVLKPLEGKEVFLAPATLRPETMYGQTNCFALPEGKYGAYEMVNGDVFIISARSAMGFACQGYTSEFAKPKCILEMTGMDLMGVPLQCPNAQYERVYTLPLLTISMGKGTGIVTSVPSDAPDDYVSLQVLKDKPDFAAKYNITPEMVDPFEVIPIIEIPGYGNEGEACATAKVVCEKLKIKTFNDKDKLAKAKDETYLKGFTTGIMRVGPHAGKKVSEVKPVIKQEMIDAGQACLYFEPESKVMSRTGDECVVAATDQWYLEYGEEKWRSSVEKHVFSDNFNAYDPASLERYKQSLAWLKEWACTRQFGLGTQLPWDDQWVIESLSDSTIYMAYYAIAHKLQGVDNLDGKKGSPVGIKPEQLTDAVYDYIYRGMDYPADCGIAEDVLADLRKEFKTWYPMALRVSAKDLIPNHLTMALYNHAAIWDDEPGMWPRGYYTNGHVQVDAEKMSKSKGNFLMMDECVELYSCDATRFACADAGDSLEDANFSRETADNAIMSLYTELEWVKETMKTETELRGGDTMVFMDSVFDNTINRLVKETDKAFGEMRFRDGLKTGWYELIGARNAYRDWCNVSEVKPRSDLLKKFIKCLAVVMAPITPHWSEEIWSAIGGEGFVVKALWPVLPDEDKLMTKQSTCLFKSLRQFRLTVQKSKKKVKKAVIMVVDSYPQWKVEALVWMNENIASIDDSKVFMGDLKKWTSKLEDKKNVKNVMQFVSFVRKEYMEIGAVAMEQTVPFDQLALFQGFTKYISSQLNLAEEDISIVDIGKEGPPQGCKNSDGVGPGKPGLFTTA